MKYLRRFKKRFTIFVRCLGLAFILIGNLTCTAHAFTQSAIGTSISNVVPMGHEWLTRLSALELFGGDPIMKPDPNDPRKTWSKGKAKNLNISGAQVQKEVNRIKAQKITTDKRYESAYKPVLNAIIGQRWVDIGGFNLVQTTFDKYNCFDAVAQEPVEVQYDHFMRRYDDMDGDGGVDAAERSQSRFIKYFVEAAMAPSVNMKVWDGGGYSERVDVDQNYFLFGRAVHLFQDSFSSEHTVRLANDMYEEIQQVKSYLCAKGSEQHTQDLIKALDYTSGDVIWKPGTQIDPSWAAYKPSNMKDIALVATEASKDLWAAFIRTMSFPVNQRKKPAQDEAAALVRNWLNINQVKMIAWYDNKNNRDHTYVIGNNQTGKGVTIGECMKNIGVASGRQMEKVKEIEKDQRACIFNIIPETGSLFDTSMHIPYNWKWKNQWDWEKPPVDWEIPK